jgi:hypothetical protein
MDGSGRTVVIAPPLLDTLKVAFALWNLPRGTPANSDPFGKVTTNIAMPAAALAQKKQVLAADANGDGKNDIITIASTPACGQDGLGNRVCALLHINGLQGPMSVGQNVTFVHASATPACPSTRDQ